MLIFKLQKYGFYPINLLFLQVRPQKLQSHQKGSENILADTGRHRICPVRGNSHNTGPAGADFRCRKGGKYAFREAGRRNQF